MGHRRRFGTAPRPSSTDGRAGFPPRSWVLERYSHGTGADLDHIDYYLAFCSWRSACISAGVLTRYRGGAMGDDGFDPTQLQDAVKASGETALGLLTAID